MTTRDDYVPGSLDRWLVDQGPGGVMIHLRHDPLRSRAPAFTAAIQGVTMGDGETAMSALSLLLCALRQIAKENPIP
ncbi:MAG: hypothetical protein AMXMBFR64_57420 [Myxococcales bacterium]